jgi:hypothetical protein
VRQCQKGTLRVSVTFGTQSVSVFGEIRTLLNPTHYVRETFFIPPFAQAQSLCSVNDLSIFSPSVSMISV